MSVETKSYSSVWGQQHSEVMRNFAAAINGEENLLAPGADGIHGVRLANAIHLSSWTNKEVSIENFDDEAYLAGLNERIRAEGKYAERD
jgi:predicted dehydrogenase